jgi:hypothetical protein
MNTVKRHYSLMIQSLKVIWQKPMLTCFTNGIRKAAYESLQKAIQLAPAHSEAYDVFGLFHILIGKKEEAYKNS